LFCGGLVIKDKWGMYFAIAPVSGAFSKEYAGPMENLVHGYAHDVTLPFGFYFFNKMIGSPLGKNKWINAACVFLGCSTFEAAQGLGLYHGTFDPKDFLAYAVGAGLAIAVDIISFKKKNFSQSC
jgi:hypothetical protein